MRKKIKCLFWIPITNRCNFQLSFGCTHLRVRRGHARRLGKRSLELLTVERADYTQEMDCHYFNSWSVHTWSVCKSWLVLMGQLSIVVLGIFATFAVSFRLVLSVEHEPEIAGPDSPSNRFYASLATRMFPLPCIKIVFFFLQSDNRTIADSWNYHIRPIVPRGEDYVCESPLGDSNFEMNIHNPFMHCVTSQYLFKMRDVIMLLHAITMVTT